MSTPGILNAGAETVPIDSLVPHPKNPNRGDLDVIGESLDAHGFYGRILAQKSSRTIIAGEHRWRSAKAKGMTEVPVEWLDVTDEEAVRILLMDNRSGELAQRDPSGLAALLASLRDTEAGFTGTGYDDAHLKELLARIGPKHTGTDEVGEPPAEPITQPGDVWVLGEHRLLCGDATNAEDYARLLDGETVGCVWTDPPYGVSIGAKNQALQSVDRGRRITTPIEGDQGKDETERLWRAAFPQIRARLPKGCPYYVCGPQGGGLGELLLLLLREGGLEARHILVWVKDRPTFSLGRLDYEYQHEPVCYGWTPGAAHPWHATEPATSTFQIPRPMASKLHPTMKPVELVEAMLTNSTKPGAIVLDPFGGSGTTLIAAEQTGRIARLMEIDPGYCDVIARRFQNLTGVKAIRDGEPVDFLT